jgi:hypothetical protein
VADYSAKIKLIVDGLQSLKQVEERLTNLNRLAALDLGKAVKGTRTFGAVKKEVDDLAGSFSNLGKIVRGIAVGTGLGALTTSINGLSQAATALKFGGISKFAAALAAATGPAAGLFKELSALAIQFPIVAGTATVAGAALLAFSPQILRAGNATLRLAKAAAEAGQPLSRLMASLASSGFRVDMFIDATQAVKIYQSRLRELSETVSVLSARQTALQTTLNKFNSESDTAAKIAGKLVDVTKRLNTEQQAQNDLLREAAGLRPESVERRATNTYNVTQRRKGFEADQAADIEVVNQALDKLNRRNINWADALGISAMDAAAQKAEQLTARFIKNDKVVDSWITALYEGKQALAEINRTMEVERLDSYTRAVLAQQRALDLYTDTATQAKRAAEALNYAGETPALRPAGFTDEDVRIKNLIDDENTVANLIANNRKTQAALQSGLDAKFFAQQIEYTQKELNAELDKIETIVQAQLKADRLVQKDFDARLAARGKAKKGRNAMMQNAMIGGAFPMLFGGGAGAVLGGAAGGFIPGNPMMSIVTSALGTVVDQFAAAATEMGASLRDPITNFEKLKEANLFASKTQEFYIQKLIEIGRITEATAAIQARVTEIIGVKGSNDLIALGASSTKLGKGFAELNSQMQAFIAGPLGTLVEILARFVGAKADLNSASNAIKDVYFNLNEAQKQQFKQRVGELKRTGIGENQAFAKAGAEFAQFTSKGKATPVQLDPATQEQQIKAAEQVADTIKGAYRTGFQLQQQALDLQRQGTDLQRRVADDIFNKQQQIARLQIDNERQRQQIAVETVDLEYRRRISQEEGRVAEALSAEADLLKTRAQGESNIATAKRLLELDITKQRRDTENYVYQLGRDIESIRRATLNYEMQVADYRLDIERKVAAERRVENAGEASGTVPSTVFTDGLKGSTTGTTAGSFPAYIPKEKLRAYLESQGFGRTSGDFTNAGHKTPNHILNAMDMGILGGSDANALRRTSEMEKKLRATGAFGNQLFGPISDPYGHGAGKGGQNIHLHIPTPGGKVKMTAKLNDLMQGKGGFTSSTASQLTTAGSQVTDRPAVPLVDAAGTGAALANLDATDAAIRKEAVTLQERLNKLQESAAVQRLEEIARGPIDLQQRRDAVQFAKEDLSVVQAGNSNLQERLAFEAQSLVKLRIRTDRDKEILENTQLQGEDRKQLVKSLEEGLNITQQQIVLDREALRLAQEKRFAVEEANIQSQLGVTGAGLQAGFVGPAAGAFESEMLKSGNTEQATRLAELTNQLTLAQVQAQGMESSVLAIGDAFGTAMTSGVASLVTGTATAKEVFAQFLNSIGQALLDAAGKMIATYIAIGIAKIFAGMGGGMQNAASPEAYAVGTGASIGVAAKGASFANGIATFARGGTFSNSVVSSPTLFKFADGGTTRTGLMGEAGPEAIMPLKRGSDGSLGVQATGLREAMGRPPGGANGSPVLNMSFQSTTINGTEYVSRDQLEAAMAATRRQAAKEGANRGMNMTLDKIQNSPSTRSRVGIR